MKTKKDLYACPELLIGGLNCDIKPFADKGGCISGFTEVQDWLITVFRNVVLKLQGMFVQQCLQKLFSPIIAKEVVQSCELFSHNSELYTT